MFNKLYENLLEKLNDNKQCVIITILKPKDDTSGYIKEKTLLTKNDIDNKTLPFDDYIYEGIHKAISLGQIYTLKTKDDELAVIEPFFTKSEPLCEFNLDIISNISNEDSTPKALLTILSSKGAVCKKAGAKMIAYVDGRTVGCIGGGCSEAGVLTKARTMINRCEYAIEHVNMTSAVDKSIDIICDGTMEVLIEVFN